MKCRALPLSYSRTALVRGIALVLSVSLVAVPRLNAAQPASLPQDTAAVAAQGARGASALRPQDYRCFESEYGSVFTNDTVWARKAIAALHEVFPRFEKFFGKPAKRLLIPYSASKEAARDAACSGSIEMTWQPMWDSTTLQKQKAATAGKRDSLIRAFKQLRPELSEQQLGDSVDLQHADYLGTFSDNVYVLMHELGHIWLIRNYQPLAISYGRGGPGWLMETAAMLMEDARLDRQRRRELIRNYRADRAGGEPKLIQPLETLFAMPHRANNAYYAQVRGVMDFLLERTQDPTIVGAIAATNNTKADFGLWLQTKGASYGLPPTIERLEQEWQAWLARIATTGLGYAL